MEAAEKNEIVKELRQKIFLLEGYRAHLHDRNFDMGLGQVEYAFPNGRFPTGAIHELISHNPSNSAATCGFIAGILRNLMSNERYCVWIGSGRTLYPAALAYFGIEPHRMIFIDLKREKEILWTIEEALKCEAVAAVVGEVSNVSFAESRRLQLAVEKSRTTGFIHRCQPKIENTLACIARWKIASLPGEGEEGFPGVAFPRWKVELVRVRNGKPGTWNIEWRKDGFRVIPKHRLITVEKFMPKVGGSYG